MYIFCASQIWCQKASIVAAPRIAGRDSKKGYLTSYSLSMPVNILAIQVLERNSSVIHVARSSKLNLSWRSIVRKSISKKLISIFPKLYFSRSCNGGSMAQKLWLQVLQSKLHLEQRTEQSELLISKPQLGLFVSAAVRNFPTIEPF
jgi:hypothetical protein